jgi:6-phosphogluconolactonase/glucosamine-6-phosphate isomerase/deaminase
MKTNISDIPEKEAGDYIGKRLLEHQSVPILLLVSGGSSLAVLEHVDEATLGSHITVGLVDDRFTTDAEGNNFRVMQRTLFYARCAEKGVQFIPSFPDEQETHTKYCERIKQALENFYKQHPQGHTIGIFGIGEDGHTASIFPSSESDFLTSYATDAFYTEVKRPALTYPLRGTVTPAFIEDKIDDVVLYAVGSTKCDNILNYMHNKNFAHYQIPALIPAQHPQSILFTDCQTLL